MILIKTPAIIALFLSSSFCFISISPLFSSKGDLDYKTITTELQEKTPLQESIANGKEVYTDFCIQCHQANGKGIGSNFPPLDESDWLINKRTKSIQAVKYGLKGEIIVNTKKYNNVMPALGLSDEEVADVMNYIMNSWSNKQKKIVTVQEVALVKK